MTEHIHDQRFDGDDPYLICKCGKSWDALTGKEIKQAIMTDTDKSELEELRDTFFELSAAQLEEFGVPRGYSSNMLAVLVWKKLEPAIQQQCNLARIDGEQAIVRRLLAAIGDEYKDMFNQLLDSSAQAKETEGK